MILNAEKSSVCGQHGYSLVSYIFDKSLITFLIKRFLFGFLLLLLLVYLHSSGLEAKTKLSSGLEAKTKLSSALEAKTKLSSGLEAKTKLSSVLEAKQSST